MSEEIPHIPESANSQQVDTYVVKVMTPLSQKAYFLKVQDPTTTVDRIFTDAIAMLRNSGKPLESQQLAQLYKDHQIFGEKGVLVNKGDLMSSIPQKIQVVNDQRISVAEVSLVSAHSGGLN